MKCFYTIFLSTLLGGGAFAANSKLNQYASISDWYITPRDIFDCLLANERVANPIQTL